VVGGFVGAALTSRTGALATTGPAATDPSERSPLVWTQKLAALGAGVLLMAVIGWNLPMPESGPSSATVALRDVQSGPDREVEATVHVEPPGSVDDPEFFNVTAWQGGGSVVAPLERIGPDVYRTTDPVPVHDFWKANIRLQQGGGLTAVPIYLPEDRAIPAEEVPAQASVMREFRPDLEVLQRERKEGVSGFLTAGAYLTVLAIAFGLFALLVWTLLRADSVRPELARRAVRAPSPWQEPRRPRRTSVELH